MMNFVIITDSLKFSERRVVKIY